MTPCVLLVEDNASDEKLTALAFRSCTVPHTLVVARDGVEALSHLCGDERCARQVAPSLVMLDLKLPRVDGFEVLRRARADAQLGSTPIVVFSASSEREDVERCHALGASAYVRKPVDFIEYKAAIAATAEFWLRWNERVRGELP